MKEIYLVRHGQTDWNHQGITMGHKDIPLNAFGRRQAVLTARRLSELRIDKIFSSDLQRAAETAEIIAQPQAVKPTLNPELREINLAGFEGISGAELRANFPHAFMIFGNEHAGAISRPHPATETRLDLLNRTRVVFDEIWGDESFETALIVCHGGVIRCIINHVLQLQSNFSSGNFYSVGIHCDNCSISQIDADESGKPVFRLINDTSHLNELGTA